MKKGFIALIFLGFLLQPHGLRGQENIDSIVLAFGYEIDEAIGALNLTELNQVFNSDYFTEQFFLVDTTEKE
ncbi:MAG: hypothetical protein AAF985_14615, partial [Bacteroidota bacterium]